MYERKVFTLETYKPNSTPMFSVDVYESKELAIKDFKYTIGVLNETMSTKFHLEKISDLVWHGHTIVYGIEYKLNKKIINKPLPTNS